MKRIVIITGGIETQGFFSLELGKTLKALGHKIFNFNLEYEEKSLMGLLRFIDKGNTVLLTFNFHGISGEDVFFREDGMLFWDEFDIPCLNIVVDHPLYYHTFLEAPPKHYVQLNIDRFHRAYMKRHFPEIHAESFLPLAGTALEQGRAGDDERPLDIVFAGNYTPPASFEQYITRLDEEYTAFYYGILEELLKHPERTLEAVAEEHIRREIPEVTEEELKSVFPNLTFLDLYVRFEMRGRALKTLTEAGFPVHVYGEGWEKLSTSRPELLIRHGSADSMGCLKAQAAAKVSLNVMPWFKDGAHDRVFNSCANGAAVMTDKSIYLTEELEEGEEVCYYDLTEMDALPELAGRLLRDKEYRTALASAGQQKTTDRHLWYNRAMELHEMIERME